MADKLVFVNEDVAKKYDIVPEKDRIVTVPGKYSGLLSKITLDAADKMHKDGDNQLTEKKATTGTSSSAGNGTAAASATGTGK